jgi:sugar lactone lactonase YvrE
MRRLLTLLLGSVLLAGCGDPLLVFGDQPGFMRIVAGVPERPGDQADTVATVARLLSPVGTALLESGELIVIDGARRILSISPAGRLTVLYRGPTCFDQACLTAPQGVAVNGNTLLIADNGSDRIWRFDLQTRALTTLAGNGQHGFAPDGATAAQATLASPADVVVLDDGRIVFSERGSHRIRAVGTDGRLQTLAGVDSAGYAGDGGPARTARLSRPTGLARRGYQLYFTDHGNNVVRLIDLQSGVIRTVAGTGIAGFSGDNGPALAAKLDQPWAADLSPDGVTLYVTEIGNHRVRALNLASETVSTFAGTGSTTYNGNGRAAGETALAAPYGVVVSPQGFLFIADTRHHIVWRTPVRF